MQIEHKWKHKEGEVKKRSNVPLLLHHAGPFNTKVELQPEQLVSETSVLINFKMIDYSGVYQLFVYFSSIWTFWVNLVLQRTSGAGYCRSTHTSGLLLLLEQKSCLIDNKWTRNNLNTETALFSFLVRQHSILIVTPVKPVNQTFHWEINKYIK